MTSRATYSLQLRARRRAVDESANATPGFDTEKNGGGDSRLIHVVQCLRERPIRYEWIGELPRPEFDYILRRKCMMVYIDAGAAGAGNRRRCVHRCASGNHQRCEKRCNSG